LIVLFLNDYLNFMFKIFQFLNLGNILSFKYRVFDLLGLNLNVMYLKHIQQINESRVVNNL